MVPVVTTTTADSASLSNLDAETLRAMVAAAGLLEFSSNTGDAHPDRPSYEITVEDAGRQNQVIFDDGVLPDAVRTLIQWIGSVPGHEQSVRPPGR